MILHQRDQRFVHQLLEQWNNPDYDDVCSRDHNAHRTELNREWVRTGSSKLVRESTMVKYQQLRPATFPEQPR